MSTRMRKGLIVALLHIAIVASLGAKLLVDRARLPRVWARTGPVDPDLPIRGRYVRLLIEAEAAGALGVGREFSFMPVSLSVENGKLVARHDEAGTNYVGGRDRDGQRVAVLSQPLAYFIPEKVPDPSRRQPGEELWVEVTVPKRGAPRPIRLGVKKDGVLTPLTQP